MPPIKHWRWTSHQEWCPRIIIVTHSPPFITRSASKFTTLRKSRHRYLMHWSFQTTLFVFSSSQRTTNFHSGWWTLSLSSISSPSPTSSLLSSCAETGWVSTDDRGACQIIKKWSYMGTLWCYYWLLEDYQIKRCIYVSFYNFFFVFRFSVLACDVHDQFGWHLTVSERSSRRVSFYFISFWFTAKNVWYS